MTDLHLVLTENQARVLRKMVIHHLEMVQGDGSLSDEDDDTLADLNALIREKTDAPPTDPGLNWYALADTGDIVNLGPASDFEDADTKGHDMLWIADPAQAARWRTALSALPNSGVPPFIAGLVTARGIASRYNVNRGAGSATARAIVSAISHEIKKAEETP